MVVGLLYTLLLILVISFHSYQNDIANPNKCKKSNSCMIRFSSTQPFPNLNCITKKNNTKWRVRTEKRKLGMERLDKFMIRQTINVCKNQKVTKSY